MYYGRESKACRAKLELKGWKIPPPPPSEIMSIHEYVCKVILLGHQHFQVVVVFQKICILV